MKRIWFGVILGSLFSCTCSSSDTPDGSVTEVDAGHAIGAGSADAGVGDSGSLDAGDLDGGASDGGSDAGAGASGGTADAGPMAHWRTPFPPSRRSHSMAWDARRHRVLLFGGGHGNLQYSDLWQWNGTAWTELNPTTFPLPREGLAMAYDSVRDRLVVFGGAHFLWPDGGLSITTLGDTWEFEVAGKRCSQLAP